MLYYSTMKVIKKIVPANRNGMKSLSFEMESIVYSNVKENFPDTWNRNFMTRSLFSDLKKLFHGKTIHTPGNTMKSFWRLYHSKEEAETVFGDIALIMNVSYHDGQTAEGVAFIDIAEKDPGKNTFSSLNKNKMRKLLSIAPHAQLLLFDYDTITGMAFPTTAESIIGNHPHSWNNWIPYTHAVSVPANLALPLDIKTTGLYKVSLPLSYQIYSRYLYGLDLDYSRPALETATGIKTGRGNPKYLVLIAVSHGGAEPVSEFDIDNKRYVEFE
ncbi:MAG: hypothetical protein A2176_15725 [Spirochaetes bacterium RBG_13_51_14]|nr:MAG: hypothetical protein A2176_15725 [Spirochaetes bacterium RBG_13_51_14]